MYGEDTCLISFYLYTTVFHQPTPIVARVSRLDSWCNIGIGRCILCAYTTQYKKVACASHHREYRDHFYMTWFIYDRDYVGTTGAESHRDLREFVS